MKNAHQLCVLLHAAGFQSFVVGGGVRDSILGLEPKDWDIATDATPDQVTFVLGGEFKVIPTGIDHGTVTVLVPRKYPPEEQEKVSFDEWHEPETEPIEITTFRSDGTYSDGRRPDEVKFSKTIEEDLARRDFTCNAIAWDVVNGTFVDPYNGRKDIADGVLRCVGDPLERFNEDGLRILRAVRIAAQKDFTIHHETLDAICVAAGPYGGHKLRNVSKERVRDEVMKFLATNNWGLKLERIPPILVEEVFPFLNRQRGIAQNEYHALDVYNHTMLCCVMTDTDDPLMRLTVLLHDIAKPETQRPHPKRPGQFQFLGHEHLGAKMAEDWMREHKFSNEEIERVTHLIKHHLIYYESDWSDGSVRKWIRKVGREHIPDLLTLARADLKGKGLGVDDKLRAMDELYERTEQVGDQVIQKPRDLAITGKDVMEMMGLKKGNKDVGTVLDYLVECVTEDPELNNRASLLYLAQSTLDLMKQARDGTLSNVENYRAS